jgi:hypothetical protein
MTRDDAHLTPRDSSDSPLAAPAESSRTKTKNPAATSSLAERSRVQSGCAMPFAALWIASRCNGGTT